MKKSPQLSIVSNLYDLLLELRKSATELHLHDGVIGILLSDKKDVVRGCILVEVYEGDHGCVCSPYVLNSALNKAYFEAHKTGLKPIGLILLNPEDKPLKYPQIPGVEYWTGGNSPGKARLYSSYRLAKHLLCYDMPVILAVIDHEGFFTYCIRSIKKVIPAYARGSFAGLGKNLEIVKETGDMVIKSLDKRMTSVLKKLLNEHNEKPEEERGSDVSYEKVTV